MDMPTSITATIREIARAGRRIHELGASEGAAGNLSVFHGEVAELVPQFSRREPLLLPIAVPPPRDGVFVVTGSGIRLHEVMDDPAAMLALVVVRAGHREATLCTAEERRFARLTSEFNSHLAIHFDKLSRQPLPYLALVHAQPRRLTYLSHVPNYQSGERLSRRLLRWQPEAILNLPSGIGYVGFRVPGSERLMQDTAAAARSHALVVWEKHGVIAYSESSVMAAVDLIDYVEAAADYEFMDLCAGARAPGLSEQEIRQISDAWRVPQSVFRG